MGQDAAAIVVAGGRGVRFGGPTRKQYLRLQGRPVVWWSLKAFQASPSTRCIVLVVPRRDHERLRKAASVWRFSKLMAIVAGGLSRADSVREGLSAVPPEVRWVAVHDAVRPLVTPRLIERTIAEARRHRAAIAACPSRDTIKLADASGRVASSPKRERVWLAQTPQAFERKLLEQAHARGRGLSVTDDSQLVERLGVRVRLVPASAENLKITVPSDLELARLILRSRSIRANTLHH